MSGDSTLVDQKTYATLGAAEENAKKFISELNNGNEKAWITYGITSWSKQQHPSTKSQTTRIEVLQIGDQLYLLIFSSDGSSVPPTSEMINQKTVIFTNILLDFDATPPALEVVTINPKWVARGVVSNSFYVLYQVRNCTTLLYLVQKLKTLFTKANLT